MRVTRIQSSTREVRLDKAAIIGKSPKKNVLKQYQFTAEQDALPRQMQDVLDRRRACTGFPIHGQRGTCALCKRETLWFCVGCHMHCCVVSTTEAATEIQSLRVILPGAGSGDEDVTIDDVKNTCYLHMYIDALQKRFGEEELR
jgi:hypothetical protein